LPGGGAETRKKSPEAGQPELFFHEGKNLKARGRVTTLPLSENQTKTTMSSELNGTTIGSEETKGGRGRRVH